MELPDEIIDILGIDGGEVDQQDRQLNTDPDSMKMP